MDKCENIKSEMITRFEEGCPFSLEDLLINNGYYKCLEKAKLETKKIKKIIKQGGKVDTSNYFKNDIFEDCKECDGKGYYSINISVPCSPEDTMWVDEGQSMCLGSETWECEVCDGTGLSNIKIKKDKKCKN